MSMKLKYITPLLATGAAAMVIAAAPMAFAADQQSCSGSGSGTDCQSHGNVQTKSSPLHVQYHASGDEPNLSNDQNWWLALAMTT
jgi:hypothetical protein